MMQDIKTAAGSWARAFLVAVLSLAAAGVVRQPDFHTLHFCSRCQRIHCGDEKRQQNCP